jgi:hypothetical protein
MALKSVRLLSLWRFYPSLSTVSNHFSSSFQNDCFIPTLAANLDNGGARRSLPSAPPGASTTAAPHGWAPPLGRWPPRRPLRKLGTFLNGDDKNAFARDSGAVETVASMLWRAKEEGLEATEVVTRVIAAIHYARSPNLRRALGKMLDAQVSRPALPRRR